MLELVPCRAEKRSNLFEVDLTSRDTTLANSANSRIQAINSVASNEDQPLRQQRLCNGWCEATSMSEKEWDPNTMGISFQCGSVEDSFFLS